MVVYLYFRGYQQQDAHEFMRYLLDRLHTELLSLLPYPNNNSPFIGPKGKSTIVTAIFGGLLQNEVTCLECRMESKKHDPFLGKYIYVTKYVVKFMPEDAFWYYFDIIFLLFFNIKVCAWHIGYRYIQFVYS